MIPPEIEGRQIRLRMRSASAVNRWRPASVPSGGWVSCFSGSGRLLYSIVSCRDQSGTRWYTFLYIPFQSEYIGVKRAWYVGPRRWIVLLISAVLLVGAGAARGELAVSHLRGEARAVRLAEANGGAIRFTAEAR